jgi:peptide/nickel transport system permease protein
MSVTLLRQAPASAASESLLRKGLRRIISNPQTVLAMLFMLIVTVLCFSAPLISGQILRVDPESPEYDALLPIGTPGHILGTDDIGRDQLARLLYGGRISLSIGFLAAIITIFVGIAIGLSMGYFGGRLDDFLNWMITTLDSLPTLYLLIIISALFQPSPEALIFVLAVTGWTGAARLVRGQTISLRDREFVISARSLGASAPRIMYLHILPNLISILAIALASSIGGLILAESTLSFLNLGVQPPTPTWGNMLSKAQSFFTRGPHMAIVPGTLIFLTVLSIYTIGDGVRDAFDPTVND